MKEKKIIIGILLALLFLNKAVAQQSFNWANSIPYSAPGMVGVSSGYDIAKDENGDLITTGFSWGNSDFDPSPTNQAFSNGDNSANLYVQKLDENGNYIWHKNYGNQGVVIGSSVTTDNSNNIYVVGTFTGTLIFDASTSITSNGSGDIFVLKLNALGNVLWARNFGLSGYDSADSIFFNKNTNELYFSGNYKTTQTPSSVTDDFFLYKLNPTTGADLWVETFGSNKSESSYGLTGDNAGNVYMVGTYIHKLDQRAFPSTNVISNLLTTPYTPSPWYGVNTFVLKINNGGHVLWAKGINKNKDTKGSVIAKAIEVDNNNNVYLIGDFNGIIDFDPNNSQYVTSNQGNKDVFITSLNNNGAFRWFQRIAGLNNNGASDRGNTIAVDNQGGIVVGGVSVNGGLFIGRYGATSGALGWLHKGGHGGSVNAIVINDCDNIYATGNLHSGTTDFNPDLNVNYPINAIGHTNAFNLSWGNATTNFDTSFTYTVCTNTLSVVGANQPFGVNPNSDWRLVKYYDPNIPNMTPTVVSNMYWWQQPTPYTYHTNALTFNYQLVPGCLYYVRHGMYLNNNCAPWQEAREYGIQSNLISCRLKNEKQELTKSKKGINILKITSNDLKIFPNPATEILQIKFTSSKVTAYQIFDLIGKNISSGKYNNEPINVSILKPGSYIIRVTTPEGVHTKQFIKK